MKKLMILAALAAMIAGATGCKSIEVERRASALATIANADGTVEIVRDRDGNPIILDGGWSLDYLQHWNWQRFDTFHATAGKGVAVDINGYSSGADTNLAAVISAGFDGGARLATAIGDAYVKIAGGGAQADTALNVAKKVYSYFTGKGGDASAATVTTANGKMRVSDGSTCVECDADGNCSTCSDL